MKLLKKDNSEKINLTLEKDNNNKIIFKEENGVIKITRICSNIKYLLNTSDFDYAFTIYNDFINSGYILIKGKEFCSNPNKKQPSNFNFKGL